MSRVTENKPDAAVIAEDLHFLVGALVRRMRAASPARAVTLSQISILKRLDREGPHTVVELARLDKITHQSVTVTVNALVERQLVTRETDPADLRRKLLAITDAGRELLLERRDAGYEELAASIAARLDPTEQHQLARALPLLRKLID